MRRLILLSIGFILFSAPSGAQIGQKSASESCQLPGESEIRRLSDEWSAALSAGHVEKLTAFYAENAAVAQDGNMGVGLGRNGVAQVLKSYLDRHAMQRLDERSFVLGCGFASEMASTRYQVTGTRKGTRAFVGGQMLTVFQFFDGQWKIVHQTLPTMIIPNRRN